MRGGVSLLLPLPRRDIPARFSPLRGPESHHHNRIHVEHHLAETVRVRLSAKSVCGSNVCVVLIRLDPEGDVSAAVKRPLRYHVDTSEAVLRKSDTWCRAFPFNPGARQVSRKEDQQDRKHFKLKASASPKRCVFLGDEFSRR